jgi:dTDP-4-dehydrorhamnose reductase
MLRFIQVDTPTYWGALADALLAIVLKALDYKKAIVGLVYHYSNEGVTSELFPTQARRPAYSVLNKQKMKETYGLKIPHWRNSLEKMIKEYYK